MNCHNTFEHMHDTCSVTHYERTGNYVVSKFPPSEESSPVLCGATRDTDFVSFDVTPFVTTSLTKYRAAESSGWKLRVYTIEQKVCIEC